jgi:hypothetical protein
MTTERGFLDWAISEDATDNMWFRNWLNDINQMCERFLDLEVDQIPIYDRDLFEQYEDGMTPEAVFCYEILGHLREDSGYRFINELIARTVKYGPTPIGWGL